MSAAEDFPTYLASRLQQGIKLRAYHISTPVTACPPLFAAGPGRPEEVTTVESHFLCLSQPSPSQPESLEHELSDVVVLGVEVLIFTGVDLTTVFVSKADSTGFLTRRVDQVPPSTSLAQTAITAFLDFLVSRCRTRRRSRVVLSLFARSQNQYLFPGSIENATKHVLDDRQLVRWWCRVLDPLARDVLKNVGYTVKAHVVVPGCDSGETKALFPISSRSDSLSDPLWTNAYPVNLLVDDPSLPPRCLVPRLPDDPKSRFLDDLDTHCDRDGQWRGIKSLDQFWEMMSYRQECSAGRLVGFVWVVFTPTVTAAQAGHSNIGHEDLTIRKRPATAVSLIDVACRDSSDKLASLTTSIIPGAAQSSALLQAGISDDVIPTKPEVSLPELPIGECPLAAEKAMSESGPLGELILSAEKYQVLMDELLQSDFAGEGLAISSSRRWHEKAMQLANVTQFGSDVEGTALPDVVSTTIDSTVNSISSAVNILTGVRKKRKIGPTEDRRDSHDDEGSVVSTLTTNLLRKKPKPPVGSQ